MTSIIQVFTTTIFFLPLLISTLKGETASSFATNSRH